MSTPSDGIGRLNRYSVTGLIGQRDLDIKMAESGPTVLTGRNGSGKSTVLRSIDAIATASWDSFLTLPLQRVSLEFSQAGEVTVARTDNGLALHWGAETWHYDPGASPVADWLIPARLPPELDPEEAHNWYLEYVDREAARQRAGLRHDKRRIMREYYENEVPWLHDFLSEFEVLFITDQRLVIEERQGSSQHGGKRVTTRTAVELASKHIARRVQHVLSAYARHSQQRDRDFPARVIAAMTRGDQVDIETLRSDLDALAKVRGQLQQVGLLPTDEAIAPFMEPVVDESWIEDEKVRPVIQTYVEDTRAKLRVLEQMEERLSLFLDFLNQHYVDKRVSLDQEGGLTVVVDRHGHELQITDLSSGEQQILVLAYEVLFRARPGTLILIDEPELSLHVLWQDTLLDDLAAMSAIQEVDFLLATHSPSLLGGREDLRRSLDF